MRKYLRPLGRLRFKIVRWAMVSLDRIQPGTRVEQLGKILSVTSSNNGRSIGDVFLSLFSTSYLSRKAESITFLTHSNHAEVSSLFIRSLDVLLLSDNPAKVRHLLPIDIQCEAGVSDGRLSHIQHPWRFFILNQTKPYAIPFHVPPASLRLSGRSIILFPERSDNERLGPGVFTRFIAAAKAGGFKVYTNCFLNSNYKPSPVVPGTEPLLQLTLAEIIAIAREPGNILAGTRCGLFDVIYFTTPGDSARLIVLYPPAPSWIFKARFHNEEVRANYPDYYFHRDKVNEFSTAAFPDSDHALLLI